MAYERMTSKTMVLIALLVTIQIFLFALNQSNHVSAMIIKVKRDSNVAPITCGLSTPCGWEVYREVNKQIRTSNYFVYSPCKCPEDSKCVRDREDISINTYVHRCKPIEKEEKVALAKLDDKLK
ncbi:hypothetical protein BLOT_009382 [Blomia tropicalis]|nr:hypothetical protein BLOT_009382 [Blomia tropicalis]